jgi:hypothetical protein
VIRHATDVDSQITANYADTHGVRGPVRVHAAQRHIE